MDSFESTSSAVTDEIVKAPKGTAIDEYLRSLEKNNHFRGAVIIIKNGKLYYPKGMA